MCIVLKLAFAPTINIDIVCELFALYDLVMEMLWLLEYSFREFTDGHQWNFYILRSYLYSLRNIIPMIKSRRMRWAGQVARMGDRRDACRLLVETP